jgi:hypothetical protein
MACYSNSSNNNSAAGESSLSSSYISEDSLQLDPHPLFPLPSVVSQGRFGSHCPSPTSSLGNWLTPAVYRNALQYLPLREIEDFGSDAPAISSATHKGKHNALGKVPTHVVADSSYGVNTPLNDVICHLLDCIRLVPRSLRLPMAIAPSSPTGVTSASASAYSVDGTGKLDYPTCWSMDLEQRGIFARFVILVYPLHLPQPRSFLLDYSFHYSYLELSMSVPTAAPISAALSASSGGFAGPVWLTSISPMPLWADLEDSATPSTRLSGVLDSLAAIPSIIQYRNYSPDYFHNIFSEQVSILSQVSLSGLSHRRYSPALPLLFSVGLTSRPHGSLF